MRRWNVFPDVALIISQKPLDRDCGYAMGVIWLVVGGYGSHVPVFYASITQRVVEL